MIHQVLGKPGAGKGVYAVEKFIVEEMVKGTRPCITDMTVHVEPWVRVSKGLLGQLRFKPEIGMRNYLLQHYGNDFNIRQRVFVISDEQGKEIYLYRKNGDGLIRCEPERDAKGRVVSYDTAPAMANGPVLYVSDEAWQKFGSRDWQETGKGLLYYAAQHRKLGDTWVIVTQNTKQIETQLRQVTQDFRVVKNHGKLKAGIFRQPAIFTVSIYGEPPTGSAQEPMSTEVFRLDKAGIGGCFDTASGVGMSGAGAADISEKIKGLPWWLLLGALGLVFLLLWKAGPLLGSFVSGKLGGPKLASKTIPPATNAVPPKVEIQKSQTNTAPAMKSYTPVTNLAPAVKVTGRVIIRGRPYVLLSDGRTVTTPELSYCSESVAIIGGEVYEWQRTVIPGNYVREVPPVEIPLPSENYRESTMHIFGEKNQRQQTKPEMKYPTQY